MIKISFAETPNTLGHTSTCVFPVRKDGVSAAAMPGLTNDQVAVIRAGAAVDRFEGEAGAVSDHFIAGPQRILLVGIDKGDAEAFEKAGAAIAAKLLTSGQTSAVVDLSGLTIAPSAEAVARMAAGASLRSWRYDKYRTKLAAKANPA